MSPLGTASVGEAVGGPDQTYGEILRLSLAARASIIRAENEQLHVQLDQLRSKAVTGGASRR